MSLVENLARRQHSPLDLMREIGALRERGYSMAQIAAKTDFSDEYISAICYLLDHGEEPPADGRRPRRDSRDHRDGDCEGNRRRRAGRPDGSLRAEGASGESGPGDSTDHRAAKGHGQGSEPWRTRELAEPKARLGRLVGPVVSEGNAAAEAADQAGDAEPDAPALRRQRAASSPGRRELRHAAAGRGHADVCLGRWSSG